MRQNWKRRMSVYELRARIHGPNAQQRYRQRKAAEALDELYKDPRRAQVDRGYCESGRLLPVKSDE